MANLHEKPDVPIVPKDPAPGGRTGGTTGRACLAAMLLAAAAGLFLRMQVPITLVPGDGYDEALFVRQATSLRHGQWLGEFDDLTLAKGPSYPAFIAAMHWLHVPLKVGEHLTLLAAALAVAGAVLVLTHRQVLAATVFVAIALDPASFSRDASRVLRDSWYASLSLLLVATFFLAVHAAVGRAGLWRTSLLAILAGWVLGVTWLCREEGPAILPALGLIAVLLPLHAFRRDRAAVPPGAARRRRMRVKAARSAGMLALMGVSFGLPLLYVVHENREHYGVARTNDLAAGAFAKAYATWSSVRVGPDRTFVPISTAQRTAVYAISPAAAELAPDLESPTNPWRVSSCRHARICDDFAGGWTVWAMRMAAGDAGHFASGMAAQRYFGRIADEIEAACSAGRLRCRPRLSASLQPVQRADLGGVLGSAWKGFTFVTAGTDLITAPTPSPAVRAEHRRSFAAVVHGVPASVPAARAEADDFAAHDLPHRFLSFVYRWLVLILLVATAAGVGIRLMHRRRHRDHPLNIPMLILAGSLGAAAMIRLLLLALVDSTNFATAQTSYQFATRATLLACALIVAVALVERAEPSIRFVGPMSHRREVH